MYHIRGDEIKPHENINSYTGWFHTINNIENKKLKIFKY